MMEVIYLSPQIAEVPLRSETALMKAVNEHGIQSLHSGPIMRATATKPLGGGIVRISIYAHESDIPLMDLSFLRMDGQQCKVDDWEPKEAHEGIIGPLLLPRFQIVPGPNGFPVELTEFMPRPSLPRPPRRRAIKRS